MLQFLAEVGIEFSSQAKCWVSQVLGNSHDIALVRLKKLEFL